MNKAEKLGTVVSDKMTNTVVVAIERVVRHELYGKAQRRTSTFMAHDPFDGDHDRIGHLVAHHRPELFCFAHLVTRSSAAAGS